MSLASLVFLSTTVEQKKKDASCGFHSRSYTSFIQCTHFISSKVGISDVMTWSSRGGVLKFISIYSMSKRGVAKNVFFLVFKYYFQIFPGISENSIKLDFPVKSTRYPKM